MLRTTSHPLQMEIVLSSCAVMLSGQVLTFSLNIFLVKVELSDYMNNTNPGMRFDPFFQVSKLQLI